MNDDKRDKSHLQMYSFVRDFGINFEIMGTVPEYLQIIRAYCGVGTIALTQNHSVGTQNHPVTNTRLMFLFDTSTMHSLLFTI